MWMVYLTVMAVLGILALVSRNEKPEEDWECMAVCRPFLKTALWLEIRAGKAVGRIRKKIPFRSGRMPPGKEGRVHSGKWGMRREQLREEMRLLYPADAEKRMHRYTLERLSGFLMLLFLGAALAFLLYTSGRMQGRLSKDGWLKRNSYGEGTARVELEAKTGKGKQSLALEIQEREYTRQELEAMLPQIRTQLEERIKGENESLDRISRDLDLPDRVKGFPFLIRWESGNYEYISDEGKVDTSGVGDKGEITVIRAVLICGEQKWEESFPVLVCREELTGEEETRRQLLETIALLDEEARYDAAFRLPEKLEDETIIWREQLGDNSPVLFILFFLAALFQLFFPDRELRKKAEERENRLLMSYPEFICKLTLLMGAGLPVRAALQRMASDYGRKKKRSGRTVYVYEELLLTCRELEGGLTEEQAYEHFGQRCRLPQYRKCTALLIQNLKKGPSGMLHSLQEEAEHSFEERKRNAREAGEKAETKLLFPMLLLLLVVMVLILVPACFSFAGM